MLVTTLKPFEFEGQKFELRPDFGDEKCILTLSALLKNYGKKFVYVRLA